MLYKFRGKFSGENENAPPKKDLFALSFSLIYIEKQRPHEKSKKKKDSRYP